MSVTLQSPERKAGALTSDRLHASELAAVLGLSPFANAWDVYARIKGLKRDEDRPEFRRGRYLERAVADWYADETEVMLLPPDIALVKDLPLHGPAPLCGTPDRIARQSGVMWGLEAKTSRTSDGWGEPLTDQVPPFYAVQCHVYMMCTGFDRWDVAAFFTMADAFKRYTLESNARIADELLRRGREWWDRHIVHGERPDLDSSEGCSDALLGMFPKQRTALRLASVEEAELIQTVAELKHSGKAYESALLEAENKLKSAIGDAEGLRYGGLKATWKYQSACRVDSAALRAKHPEIAKEVEKVSSTRVLRVTMKEE